jgi:hypothetical protein
MVLRQSVVEAHTNPIARFKPFGNYVQLKKGELFCYVKRLSIR